MSALKQEVQLKSTEFQPKQEYLLVKPVELDKGEKTTESGLIIPIARSSMERPTVGRVIEVGVDIEDIKIDDVILWPQTDGLDLQMEDGDFVLLRYASVIGSKKQ
jgi:co-chaperonin GroES (HSP10)